MLQLQNLSFSIDDRILLKQVNWVVEPARRYALIGPNGAGKTTLFRIITGVLAPHQGEIIKPKNYVIGHLPQEELAFEQGTVLGAAMQGQPELARLETEIEKIQERMKQADQDKSTQERLLKKSGDLDHQFGLLGGYEWESQTKKILQGLGFSPEDFHRPVSELSGGWRMRVYLTRLLLQNPDLLLLDEPTNHLDIPALEWLERFLIKFKGSVVIVSHDRFFVERLAEEIAELENSCLTHYAGHYHFYEAQKELQKEQLLKQAESLQQDRERINRFVERFRYKATKARQVQSRVKQLEKMESIEIPNKMYRIHFQIQCPVKSYHEVCRLQNISFGYAQTNLFKNLNLELYRENRIALIGANGTGKTTLARIVAGQLLPRQGNINWGQHVAIGYYAQHQTDVLDLDKTVLDEVYSTAAEIYRTEVRNILGVFRFSGDDVLKKISVLSGGEKARVCLAKILLSPVNFLIMDEPTNHLDLASKEALEKALEQYDGTLLIISHDRYFLDKLVNAVVEIKEGNLQTYTGNYSYYLDKRETQNAEIQTREKFWPAVETEGLNRKEQKRLEAKARQKVSLVRNQLTSRIRQLELVIEQMETEKKEIEKMMGDPLFYKSQETAADKVRHYQEINGKLPGTYQDWEKLNAELEIILRNLQGKE
jgi:ATP-binding cassette subfamily F protein 3